MKNSVYRFAGQEEEPLTAPDEKVIWQGHNRVQKDNAPLPAAMLIVLFAGIFLGAPLMNREMNSYAAGIAIMVFFALPFIISYTSYCIIGRRETRYTVTDRRIIAEKNGNKQDVPLDDILRVKLVRDGVFRMSVMFMSKGTATREETQSIAEFAAVWDTPLADRLYSLKPDEAKLVYNCINTYIEQNRKGDTENG